MTPHRRTRPTKVRRRPGATTDRDPAPAIGRGWGESGSLLIALGMGAGMTRDEIEREVDGMRADDEAD